jgi:hypothetical protein
MIQTRLTNENDDDPGDPVHLSLVDIFVNDDQEVTRHGKSVVQDLYPRSDLQVIPDGFVQGQKGCF